MITWEWQLDHILSLLRLLGRLQCNGGFEFFAEFEHLAADLKDALGYCCLLGFGLLLTLFEVLFTHGEEMLACFLRVDIDDDVLGLLLDLMDARDTEAALHEDHVLFVSQVKVHFFTCGFVKLGLIHWHGLHYDVLVGGLLLGQDRGVHYDRATVLTTAQEGKLVANSTALRVAPAMHKRHINYSI